jgi:hypothetical protein
MGADRKKIRWLWPTGAVLTGLVVTTWLFWPSDIDPRFVGTWRLSVTSRVFKLGADGTLIQESHGEPVRWTQWRVRNGTFYNFHNFQNYSRWQTVLAWVDRIRKGRAREDSDYPIVKVTPDAIVLHEPPNGNFVLLRVPDGFVPPPSKPGFQLEEDRHEIDKAHEERMRAVDPKTYAMD